MTLEYAQFHKPRSGDDLRAAKAAYWAPIMRWFATLIIGIIALVGFLTCVGALATRSRLGIFLQLLPVFALLALVALSMLLKNGRNLHASMVLFYVTQAVRMNLPLPAFL